MERDFYCICYSLIKAPHAAPLERKMVVNVLATDMSLPPERKASHEGISVEVLGCTRISALSDEKKLLRVLVLCVSYRSFSFNPTYGL